MEEQNRSTFWCSVTIEEALLLGGRRQALWKESKEQQRGFVKREARWFDITTFKKRRKLL